MAPFPDPEPATIASHSDVVVAVHEHPRGADTAKVPVPPVMAVVADSGSAA
jgi:hypothetical protein